MKVIIPLAGLGTRLRPHTLTKPKPLVSVAGKPVLAHILDKLSGLEVEEMIFITGYLGNQIEDYVRANYAFHSVFIEQSEQLGQAHAISLTREHLQGDVLIIFVDTVFDTPLDSLPLIQSDGVLYVKEVEDPARFGVAIVEDGRITRLVEKPKTPVSRLAVIGVYYFKDAAWLLQAVDEVLARDIKTAGEYFLADAIQLMIDAGARIEARPVEVWEDCGKPETLLHTNRYLLSNGAGARRTPSYPASIIVPPVHIDPGAVIENAIVGPNVSVASGVTIRNAIVTDSIVNEGAVIENAMLTASLIGSEAEVRGSFRRLNVGDCSQVDTDGS